MIFSFFILENKKSPKNVDDIELAIRIFPESKLLKNIKIIHVILTFIIFSLLFLFVKNTNYLRFSNTPKSSKTEKDLRVLGHFPYKEAAYENLIEIQPNILVHKGMYKSLKEMQDDAEKDGCLLYTSDAADE